MKQGLTKVQKVQQGQAKAQAKGAKRKAVVTFKLGDAIADALEQQGESVRSAIVNVIGHNQETVLQAMVEVKARRDQRIKECHGERKEKQIASVRVMYSRISVILGAIYRKENLDKIKASNSFATMYAFASRKATKSNDKRKAKPFNADQFKAWDTGLKRIVGSEPTKQSKDADKGKFADQLARLEQHTLNCLGVLQAYSHVTRIPVRDMLGLTAKRKQHLRKAA